MYYYQVPQEDTLKELEKINVKYKHINFSNYEDLIKLYKCINVYLISSIGEEGGPRAIMGSFASKTPLVSTNVGQAVRYDRK